MCLSNRQSIRLIVWIKYAYQRYHLSHLLLLFTYVAFLVLSATAYFLVESLQAKNVRTRYLWKMEQDRKHFVRDQLLPHIFNNSRLLVYIHESKSTPLMEIMNERLEKYEHNLQLRPHMSPSTCTFSSSLLFVFSSVTTMGGSDYPLTPSGRILSIIISIIGIPFTIVVIKDLAFLLAKLFYFPCMWLEACWAAFRFCTLRGESEDALDCTLREVKGVNKKKRDYRVEHSQRLLSIPPNLTTSDLAQEG